MQPETLSLIGAIIFGTITLTLMSVIFYIVLEDEVFVRDNA